ncbi:MAG: hypothetical protein H6822_22470 [Planctomycetaceae bacterium]|nr:hypothetical protein [Planctomycetales bacterium]MCB9924961.1 hypothetical protein [Planctomycetaceae bacterium]
MFAPILEVVVTFLLIVPAVVWSVLDPSVEAKAAVATTVILFVAALLHLAFSFGRRSVSEKESAERYERQKEHFRRAHEQIQNEESHLQKMLRDPSLVAGVDYAEHKPFELIADRSRPLTHYCAVARLAKKVISECERNMRLPSGQKDVSKLVPLLEKLDTKLRSWLRV